MGQGTRMILDFFLCDFWKPLPPSGIIWDGVISPLPHSISRKCAQNTRPPDHPTPPSPLLHHHHHANDENGLQKYCLKHIDSQKHFLVHKSPIDNVFLHPCPFSTIFRKSVVRIVLMVRS